MTTKEAYKKMIMQRNVALLLDLSGQTVRDERQRVKAGKYPTIDTMIKRLSMAGWNIVRQMEWKQP
jgi:hypothetical protein